MINYLENIHLLPYLIKQRSTSVEDYTFILAKFKVCEKPK